MMSKSLLLLFAVTCGCLAQSLSEQATALLSPRAGATLAEPVELKFGAMTIHTNSAKYLLVGDKVSGLAFETASFSFTVTDPHSQAVAQRNFASFPRAKLNETVTRGLIWSDDPLVPAPAENTSQGEPLPWLQSIIEKAKFELPINCILQSRLAGRKGTVYALFVISRVDGDSYYVYKRDPLQSRTEEIFALDRQTGNNDVAAYRNALFSYKLAAQPIDRAWHDTFSGPTIATHEAIEVDNPKDDLLKVKTTSSLKVIENGTKLWRANLTSYRLDNRYNVRPNNVTSVKVNGQPADFLHYNHELLVKLDRAYNAGETLTIETENSGEIAIHPDGNQYWQLGTWAWYPQPDMNGEIATLDIVVRCPKDYKPYASGDRVSLETVGEQQVLVTHLDKPVQFPVVVAGKWYETAEERDGIRCTVGSYGIARKKGSERLINLFFSAIQYYGQLFGTPYPFKDMTILEVKEWGMGQAPANVIFISQEAFDTKGALLNQLFSEGVNERFMHEVAHTWWGMIVKMDSIEEQWLTESFADYSAAMCMKAGSGRNGEAEFKRMFKHWQGNTKLMTGKGSIYLANHLSFYKDGDWYDRIYLLYNKGPLVIHALRMELGKKYGEEQGDKIFLTLLRSMVTNFKFKWGATRHMVGMLNQITKDNWQPFFDKYVYGTEVPTF